MSSAVYPSETVIGYPTEWPPPQNRAQPTRHNRAQPTRQPPAGADVVVPESDKLAKACLIFASLMLVVTVVLVAVFLPISFPEFQVNSFSLSSTDMNASSGFRWDMVFGVRNNNRMATFSYSKVVVFVLYNSEILSVATTLEGFRQGGKNTTSLQVSAGASTLNVKEGALSAISRDVANGTVGFSVKLECNLKAYGHGRSLTTETYPIKVYCDHIDVIRISPNINLNATAGTMVMTGGSRQCTIGYGPPE